MKKNKLWKLTLIIGITPFLAPIIVGAYRMIIESWNFMDWLIMYSFIYWPTYILGLVFILVSLYKLK